MKYEIKYHTSDRAPELHGTYETREDALEELKRIAICDLQRDNGNDSARENGVRYKDANGSVFTPDELETLEECEELDYVFPYGFYRWDYDSKIWEIEEI